MAAKALPTPDALRQLLDYDPDTGLMLWRERDASLFAPGRYGSEVTCRAWNTQFAGAEAFITRDVDGYRVAGFGGRLLKGHRVAFAVHHGRWPVGDLDHINGVRDDNRIANLREVTSQQNARNRRSCVGSTSRFKGVAWKAKDRRWQASIGDCGKYHHIGSFACETSAAIAYDRAARVLHGEHARLNINEPRQD